MTLDAFYSADGPITTLTQDMAQKILLALPDYSNDPTDQAVLITLKNKTKQFNINWL